VLTEVVERSSVATKISAIVKLQSDKASVCVGTVYRKEMGNVLGPRSKPKQIGQSGPIFRSTMLGTHESKSS
jgi:hypothetical protein